MKSKWIRLGIARKVNQWIQSIDDEKVRELVAPNVIVTGGCIVSMLLNEKVNDFDLYLRNHESALALADYYVKKFRENPPTRFKNAHKNVEISIVDLPDRIKIVIKSAGVAGEGGSDEYQYFEGVEGDESQNQLLTEELGQLPDVDNGVADPADVKDGAKKATSKGGPYRPIFLTANCVTLSDKVQVILRFFGEPEQIHSNYDFVHCTCYWDSQTRQLVLSPAALESILAKDLRYLGESKYPICAMVRIRKFLKRGWHITAGQMLKIAWSINQLDMKRIDVLEDQLIGVDTAYFLQLIRMLRAKDVENVDAAYLMEAIDRIF